MFEALIACGLFASSFAATNLDNLALLVGWLMTGRGRRNANRKIFVGHLLGMWTILGLTVAFSLGANLIPIAYVGYLGVIPISLGLKGLYDRTQKKNVDTASGHVAPLSIAATQVANGVDTVLVFGPLLADSESRVDLVIVIGFIVMTFAWFGLAQLLERHASRLALLERYGHWVAPIVLIVVGLYILDNTTTDVLPGN